MERPDIYRPSPAMLEMYQNGADYVEQQMNSWGDPYSHAIHLLRDKKLDRLTEAMIDATELVCPNADLEGTQTPENFFLYGAIITLDMVTNYLPQTVQDKLAQNFIQLHMATRNGSFSQGEWHDREQKMADAILDFSLSDEARQSIPADFEDLLVNWGVRTSQNQQPKDKYITAGIAFVFALARDADQFIADELNEMELYKNLYDVDKETKFADSIEQWLFGLPDNNPES